MVLAESLSRGLPCISSNCPTGPDDLIINGFNGFLYDINDYQKLREILNDFIEGKVDFKTKDVKSSLDNYYDPKYINRFIKYLKIITRNKLIE